MLLAFLDEFGGAGAVLRGCRERGERAEAERLLHTLKSSAAGIGADAVSAIARELERASRDALPSPEQLVALDVVLDPLLAALRDWSAPQAPAAASDDVVPPAAECIEALAACLRDDDAQAFDWLQKLQAQAPAQLQSELPALRSAIESLDYGSAARLLQPFRDVSAAPPVTPAGSRQKVLVVDDQAGNRLLLFELFKDSYSVLLAKDAPMALELAHKHRPDLILLDVMMPRVSGYEAIAGLKLEDATRDIPVIFITALGEDSAEERGLLLGAVDYITKPFHPPIVRARVHNHMQAARQRHLLERHAMFDPLTELPNRRRLERALARRHTPGQPLSLGMLDVDHFKHFNDRYGHTYGDRALRQIAQALQANLRGGDELVARFGGEEFVLWLPGAGRAEAEAVAERMRRAVSALRIDHPEGPLQVAISIGGVSAVVGSDGALPEDLLETADGQLYIAKREGRDRVRWAELVGC
jgi:diguanylate cyclase (GGDEF)-like protein